MVTDELRRRLVQALRGDAGGGTMLALAVLLRDEGVEQITLYRLFAEYFERTAADDPLYESLQNVLDAIWGGSWAKGNELFNRVLTDAEVAAGKGGHGYTT